MSVPFEQIGVGQLGRYVYQVIGKDGPIFNPKNISYLEANPLSSNIHFDPQSAVAGLSGLNLVGSFANLAISATVFA